MSMLPVLFVLVLTGLVPMVIYATLLWLIDHWEREPWYLIALAFLWGVVPSSILALISQMMIHGFVSAGVFYDPDAQLWNMVVIVAPVTEESIKAIALLFLFVFLRRHIDSLLDGLIYGAAVGFGFAAAENMVYFSHAAAWGSLPVDFVFLRAFIFGSNHALFTGLTGLGFGLARFRKSRPARILCPILGLALAMLFHAAHNALAVQELFDPFSGGLGRAMLLSAFGIFWVIVLMVTSLLVQGTWVRRYLRDEVQLGILTSAQARVAGSLVSSVTTRGERRRFNQLCARLAMKKHLHDRLGERGQTLTEIEALRRQVADFSRRIGEPGTRPQTT